MRKRLILLAGIITIGMSTSALAEEAPKKSAGDVIGGLIGSLLEDQNISDTLFGENGLLNELLPEGADLSGIAGSLEEKVDAIKSEGGKILESIKDKVQNEDGSFDLEGLDLSGLGDLAGQLVGSIAGIGGSGDLDLDSYLAKFNDMRDAVKEYSLEKNSQSMEIGDAQILSAVYIYEDEDLGDEVRAFAQIVQSNYTLEENVLMFLSGSSIPTLFTLNWDEENGSYYVVDAREAADGEEYTASLEEMCAEVGCSLDECLEDIGFSEITHMGDMVTYLDEHPEIEGIEFEGEIMNAEELEALFTERLYSYFSEPETDSAVTEVESVESAA